MQIKISKTRAHNQIFIYDYIIKFMKAEKPFIHCTLENTIPEIAVAAREYIEALCTKNEL